MGHAPQEVGDLYSKLGEDLAFRQLCRACGLGFQLVTLVPKTEPQFNHRR
jgi:hypothetical protein